MEEIVTLLHNKHKRYVGVTLKQVNCVKHTRVYNKITHYHYQEPKEYYTLVFTGR